MQGSGALRSGTPNASARRDLSHPKGAPEIRNYHVTRRAKLWLTLARANADVEPTVRHWE